MKKLKFPWIMLVLLYAGSAFAVNGGNVYFVDCKSCDPTNTTDPVVKSILNDYFSQTSVGDIVSIMEDWKDPVTGARPVANYKRTVTGYIRQDEGDAIYTNSPYGPGDGRSWVTVGLVLVMYPEPPPSPSVTVEGVFEGSAGGGGGGGCTLKESETDCASLNSVNPGSGPQTQ